MILDLEQVIKALFPLIVILVLYKYVVDIFSKQLKIKGLLYPIFFVFFPIILMIWLVLSIFNDRRYK